MVVGQVTATMAVRIAAQVTHPHQLLLRKVRHLHRQEPVRSHSDVRVLNTIHCLMVQTSGQALIMAHETLLSPSISTVLPAPKLLNSVNQAVCLIVFLSLKIGLAITVNMSERFGRSVVLRFFDTMILTVDQVAHLLTPLMMGTIIGLRTGVVHLEMYVEHLNRLTK